MQKKAEAEIWSVDEPSALKLRSLVGESTDVVWYNRTDSTNDRIKSLLKEGRETGCLVRVANEQTRGRGTQGRVWHNEIESLLLSVGLPAPAQTQGIALAIGMGIREVLCAAGGELWLKWPNDLWTRQAKVGGILCEKTTQHRQSWLIVGVGINLQSSEKTHGCVQVQEPKEHLCAKIVRRICQETEHFSTQRLRWISQHWESVDWIGKKRIAFETADGETQIGYAAGVDEQGCFVLRDACGEHHFPSGSIKISE